MSDWKYTIPILRVEEDSEGKYLVGEASGPERDSHGTEMAPEAVSDFAGQIAERVASGNPIPYIDSHAKDGVLRQLGHVMEGWLTPDFHLVVRVRLDELNPAAMYLWNSIRNGRQYGMSIGGHGVEHAYRKSEDGNSVLRFTKVLLKEISNTTRPSWVPSFGTVLARSIDQGVSEVSEELAREETPVEETAPAQETQEVASDVEQSTDEQTTTEPVTVENAEAASDESAPTQDDVERARIAKRDVEALKEKATAFLAALESIGVNLEDPAPAAPEPTPSVENSDTADEETVEVGGIRVQRDIAQAMTALVTAEVERTVAPLREEIEKKDAYIEELLKLPAGKVPAPVVREKFEDDIERMKGLSPEERLKASLSRIYADR